MPEPTALLSLSEDASYKLPSAFPADRGPAYPTRQNSITLKTKTSRKFDSSSNPTDPHGSMYADHNASRRPPANSLSSRSLMQQTSQREQLQPPRSRAGRHSLDSAFPSDNARVSQQDVGFLSSGHQAPLLMRKGPAQAGNSLKGATAVFGLPSKAIEGRGSRPGTTTGSRGIGGQQAPVSKSSDDIWNSQPFGRRTRQSRPVPSLH